MRKITTVVYMMTNQPDLPSVQEYWFIRNNHNFCVMMTRFRDSPQLLIKCKSSEKNYLQLLKAFYSNNAMLMMWLTLGQGHDTSSCHEQPLCNLCMNFLCFFFFLNCMNLTQNAMLMWLWPWSNDLRSGSSHTFMSWANFVQSKNFWWFFF